MANNVKRRFTVDLEISLGDAEKKVKGTVGNIKTILADLGKASDKMTYFKELADYLGQVDAELDRFKQKHGEGLFNQIFSGLDANLRHEMESVFGTAREQLTQLETIRSRFEKMKAGGATLEELKPLEQELKDLYKSIGRLDDAKISGRGALETRLQKMEDALSNFATVWDGVNKKVSQGLGFGGGSAGVGGASTGGGNQLSAEVQTQIDKLNKQINELKDAQKRLSDVYKIADKVENKAKGSDAIPDSYMPDLTIESVQKLIDEFNSLKAAMESSDKSSADYYNNLAKIAEIALSLQKASAGLRGNDSLRQLFMDNGMFTTLSKLRPQAMNVLKEVLGFGNAKIKPIDDMVKATQSQIRLLESGSAQTQKANKAAGMSYQELKNKVKEYYDLVQQYNDETLDDDAIDKIGDKMEKLERVILKLGKGTEQVDAVRDSLAKLATDRATFEDTFESIANTLGITEIDPAIEQASLKLKEFLNTAKRLKELTSLEGIDSESALNELRATRDELKELQQQGLLTEQQMHEVANAFQDAKGNFLALQRSGSGSGTGSGSGVGGAITNVDFTSLENTIKSETSALAAKLDNVLKVELVKDDTKDIQGAIESIRSVIDNISNNINQYNSLKETSAKQAEIDIMKANLTQLFKFVSDFNARKIDGHYQGQEITASILSDGSMSIGYGEDGSVPWDRVAGNLVGNLTKSLLTQIHSHPWEQFWNGKKWANDSFSGASGDLSAFGFEKDLGAKISSMITGNIMRIFDSSKLSESQMIDFKNALADIEKKYTNKLPYSNYVGYDRDEGQVYIKGQNELRDYHKVNETFEGFMYEAFKRIGISKDQVDQDIFKKYNLTDDAQLTELAERLVQLSNASQNALNPVERLKQIISQFYGDVYTNEAKSNLESYKKGELTAAEVFNRLNGMNLTVSQDTMDSLYRIDAANEMSAVESLLTQITSILDVISSNISNIDNNTRQSTSEKFDTAINDILDIREDVNNKYLTKDIKSIFDPLNISEFKNKEVLSQVEQSYTDYRDALQYTYTDAMSGNLKIDEVQTLLNKFATALSNAQDAMRQIELYEDRTRQEVITDTGEIATYELSQKYNDLAYDQSRLLQILSQAKLDINSAKSLIGADLSVSDIEDGEVTAQLQSIQAVLDSIYGVLQKFTGIKSDEGFGVEYSKPVQNDAIAPNPALVDNIFNEQLDAKFNMFVVSINDAVSQLNNLMTRLSGSLDDVGIDQSQKSDVYNLLSTRLPQNIATEDTLLAIKNSIEQLINSIKPKDDAQNDQEVDVQENLRRLVDLLSGSVKTLQDVASGIVQQQKTQKRNTSVAMARIQDPTQYRQISDIAAGSVNQLGDEVQIKTLQALANGLVKVEGAFKNVNGEWEGFTVKVNEANEAIDLATDKQSAFAKALNKSKDQMNQDDNPVKFSPEETYKKALEYMRQLNAEGKKATLQYQDSGRYTVSTDEMIGGLSKKTFQTFDEFQTRMSRTTVTLSNNIATAINDANNLITTNLDKVGNANLLQQYTNEYANLIAMNQQYESMDNIQDADIAAWNQQIVLVQRLGSEISSLIKQQEKLEGQAGLATSVKRLNAYQTQADNIFNDLGFGLNAENKTLEQQRIVDIYDQIIEKVDLLKKSHAVLTDSQVQDINQLIASLKTEADAYSKIYGDKKDVKKKNTSGITPEDQARRDAYLGALNKYKSELTSEMRRLDFTSVDQGLGVDQQDIADEYKNIILQIEQYIAAVKRGEQVEVSSIQASITALKQKTEAYRQQNNLNNSGTKKTSNVQYGSGIMGTIAGRHNNLQTQISNDAKLLAASLLDGNRLKAALDDYEQSFKDLKTQYESFKNVSPTKDQEDEFKAASAECNKLGKEVEKLIKAYQKMHNDPNIVKEAALPDGFVNTDKNRAKQLRDYVESFYGSDAKIGNFKNNYRELLFTIDNGDGTFTEAKVAVDSLGTSLIETAGDTTSASSKFTKFFGEIGGKFKELWVYTASRFGVDEVLQQIRNGIQYVREIDSALTELKKVTNETDATYDAFLETMSKTANAVGSTVSDLTTMASEWARLGYSLEEAGMLAESTAILLNVSEFDDATAASEALISTMQAFQYTADESRHVVDILNEVGNNYAVSSDGIATALQDSASALMEGGNNLEQATALVAAANRVVQDPSSVGSALRTISLRLRGTSVEILEEMGEETDGVVESTSKLQEKLKALTGVDILTNAGAYKDTYTILKEIGAVWQDLDSLDQAAALELMAGKNRANTLSAILNNMKDLEGAYESALNAEGSALQENEAHLNSIQGRIELFTTAVQTMWMHFLNDDALKFIIDIGTALIKLVDTIGVIPTAIGGFSAWRLVAQNIGKEFENMEEQIRKALNVSDSEAFDGLTDSVKKATDAKKDQIDITEESIHAVNQEKKAVDNNTVSEEANRKAIEKGLPIEDLDTQKDRISGTAERQEAKDIDSNTKKTLENNAANAAGNKFSSVISTTKSVASSVGGALLKVGGSLLKGVGWGLLISLITKLAGGLLGKVNDKIHETERAIERADEALNSYNNEMESITSQKDTVDELSESYTRLSGGVNTLTNDNIGLTVESYEEYLDVCNRIASMYPELVTGYDAQGNAILNLKGKVDNLTAAYREAQEEAARTLLTDQNKEDVWTKYEDNMSSKGLVDSESKKKYGAIAPITKYITPSDKKDVLEAIVAMGYDELSQLYEYDVAGNSAMWDVLRTQMKAMGTYADDDFMYEVLNQSYKPDKKALESVDAYKAYYSEKLSELNQEISEAMSGVRKTLSASLIFNPIYQKLDDASQGMVEAIINNLDPKIIAESGAQSVDEFIEYFSEKVLISAQDNSDFYKSLTNASNNIVKAMASGSSEAYENASSEFDKLVARWRDESGNIVVDPDADVVTQYLQRLAQDIENESKNYEVRLQMQYDFDSKEDIDDVVDNYAGEAREEIQRAFDEFNLGDDASIKDVYAKISTIMSGDDGVLRVDELNDAYNAFLSGDMSDWAADQRHAMVALDAVMKMYGVDIDTVIAKLVEFGFVSESLDNIASFNLAAESTNEDIDKFQEKIDSLKGAWESLNSKEMTKSEFIDLVQEFPELMDSVDLSDDNWMVKAKENVEELNATTVSDFISELESIKEAMQARGEDTTIIDSFIGYAKQLKTLDGTSDSIVHAQLKYHDLVRSLDDVIGTTMVFSKESDSAADALLEQINTVKQSINQYELLEETLLGTTNAFTKFAEAQETDSKNTYGADYVNMVQTMYDAIYKTGEVGSAQFWAAVEANVPDDIYAHLTPGPEQIKAISDYLNNNVFPVLTLNEESFSIDYSDIENFVEKAQNVGVFTGLDATAFGLSSSFIDGLEEDEDALEAFADSMGMTVTQVYAYLSEIDKYNADGLGLSILLQLDRSTTGQITLATNELEKLYVQRKALLEQGADEATLNANMRDIYAAESNLAGIKQQATDIVMAYAMIDNAVIDTSKTISEVLPKEFITELGLTGDEKVVDVLQVLNDYLLRLGEPTVVDLDVAKEQVEEEIKELEAQDATITAHVELNKDGLYEVVNADDYTGQVDLQHYVELKNADNFINTSLSEGLTTTETLLSEIAENTAIMAGKDGSDKGTDDNAPRIGNGGSAGKNGGARSDSSKPEPNQEAALLTLDTGKELSVLADAIIDKQVKLASSGVMTFGQSNDYQNLGAIHKEVTELHNKLLDGSVYAEDAKARFSELQAQAAKLGVVIPTTLEVDEEKSAENINTAVENLTPKADVDLTNRPLVKFNADNFGAWIEEMNEEDRAALERGDSTATVYSKTYYKRDFGNLQDGEKDAAIVVTPILPDGTVLSPAELADYAERLLNGEEIEPNITLGFFDGENFEADADQFANGLHNAQAEFYGLNDATQETSQSVEDLGQKYDLVIKHLESFDPNTMVPADEFNDLGLGITITEAISAADAIEMLRQAKQRLATSGSVGSIVGPIEKEIPEVILTYSELENKVATFNNVVTQTHEIIGDGIEVTQEYKDSLVDLGINELELKEYFDDNNKLMVKNAKGLKDLVKIAKKNTSENIKLAKSQAQLEYYELYKEMHKLTEGHGELKGKALEEVDALYSQMSALQKTIAQYSLLEAQLLGASNAYEKLAEAQEIDSATDYGSKAEEMVSILGDVFRTMEIGTETAQVAMLGLVPEEVYKDIDTLQGKIDAAYAYFTGGPISKLFTIEYDDEGVISSVEMTRDNLEAYVDELASDAGGNVFTGSWDEGFSLNEEIETLDDFMKATNMTKEVAFAFLTSLERYDANWLNGDHRTLLDQLLGEEFDYRVYDATQRLAELEYAIAHGTATEDDMSEYRTLTSDMQALGDEAVNNTLRYAQLSESLEDTKEKMADLNAQYKEAEENDGIHPETGESLDDISAKMDIAQGEAADLIKAMEELGVPTELQVQFAADEIQEQIDDFKKELKEALKAGGEEGETAAEIQMAINEVDTKGLDALGLTQNPDGTWSGLSEWTAYTNLDPESQESVIEYIDLINAQHIIDALMGDGFTTIEQHLESIVSILQQTYELQVDTSVDSSNVDSFISWLAQTPISKTVKFFANTIGDVWNKLTGGDDLNGTAHVNGTAFKGGSWGAPKTETALVGELGPEMVVRGNRWFTVGDNGAEFTDIKKGDVIFNHKQTEDLLSKGYVTGRGKAYAEGTAYRYAVGYSSRDEEEKKKKQVQVVTIRQTKPTSSITSSPTRPDVQPGKSPTNNKTPTNNNDGGDSNKKKNNNNNKKNNDKNKDKDKEVFDWFEVLIDEINDKLELMSAKLENAAGISAKNSIIDSMLEVNEDKLSKLKEGLELYTDYANKQLQEIPKKYRDLAKDGSVAIEDFAGDADEETLEAIRNYREWAEKVDDVKLQIEELETEMANLAKQKFDNIAQGYENQIGLIDGASSKLEAYIALQEESGQPVSAELYKSLIDDGEERLALLQKQKAEQKAVLEEQVKLGNIKVGSDQWYEMVQQLEETDAAIIDCQTDIEKYKNSINDIKWDNFDQLIIRIGYVNDEIDNTIGLLSEKDLFDDQGAWTEEGIASLGLYAQKMESAQYEAEQYAKAIDDLNKGYKNGEYSETEYLEKLNELKNGQNEAIQSYNDSKKAIKDLNAERIAAVKEGMEKEIDAYAELISKKKEALNADKEAYDFEKQVASQQKDIANIQRQLAALAGDNSASAIAKRRQLEAELLEAQGALEDTYYEKSIQTQQDALDKEQEAFEESKNKEMEELDKYLENTDQVLKDSVNLAQANATSVYETLNGLADDYNLTLSDSVVAPWKEGENAISEYQTVFTDSTSATVEQLQAIQDEWQAIIDKMDEAAKKEITKQNNENDDYTDDKKEEKDQGTPTDPTKDKNEAKKLVSTISGQIKYGQKGKNVKTLQKALNALGFSVGEVDGVFGDKTLEAVKKFQAHPKFGGAIDADGVVGKKTKKKFKAAGYAKGTLGVKQNELAIIDELGLEEIVMHAQGGKLAYLTKGSAVIPHDISKNLMEIGQLDPSDVLERSKPSIGIHPEVHNTEIHIDNSIAELIHIDNCSTETLPDVKKIVNDAIEKHAKNLNNALKRYTR